MDVLDSGRFGVVSIMIDGCIDCSRPPPHTHYNDDENDNVMLATTIQKRVLAQGIL